LGLNKNHPFRGILDSLMPDKPIKLESVGHFAIEAVMDNLDYEAHQVVTSEMFLAWEEENEFKTSN